MPFGGGPQICLGMEFAPTKMVMFLHHLVSIMNGRWSIPMRELFRIHFLCSKKDFHSKICKKQPLEVH
ncbi:unnamed protein product [Sphagnum jensenii]|uniref:Cytochrome P450 n=1 Tax=Sphagnum jensenii TaxID=128206 RepID=A0ABP1AX36_9BRYO